MAIDMSTENSSLLLVSPRISFSHDFCHTGGGGGGDEIVTSPATTATEDRRCRRDSSLLDLGKELSDEFDFCISTENIEEVQICSAEELFSNGLIRTVHLQEKKLVTSSSSSTKCNVNNCKIDGAVVVNGGCTSKARQIQFQAKAKVKFKAASLPPLPTNTNGILISKQEISNSNSNPDNDQEKNQSKSFWKIKRSSSLHCDNKKSSFWSLPLLSRSNSTGSVPNNNNNSKQQQQTTVKENNQNRQNGNNSRQQIKHVSRVSSSSSSSAFYVYPLSQKPPLMRRNNNGVRINPVLNVPSPHISKGTANLLGLGSFFRSNGKDKNIKK